MAARRQNGFWSDLVGTKTTVRSVKSGSVSTSKSRYKGYTIFKDQSGDFSVPGLDRYSKFDTLRDAKRFVDFQTKKGMVNPRRNSSGQFQRCVDAVKRSGSAYDPAAVCAASERRRGLMNPVDYMIRQVGSNAFQLTKKTPAGWKVVSTHRSYDAAQKAWQRRAKRSNPLPLAAAQALESSALAPYQKRAEKEAKRFQKKIGLKLNQRKNPRNPADQAAAVYEGLHGRASDEQIKIITDIHEHEHVAAFGELVTLVIMPERGSRAIKLSGFETRQGQPAFLTTNEKRTQLFVDGGDQSVNVATFGIGKPVHETEVLGSLYSVDYYTTKDHLGKDGGEAVYHHVFSKKRRPVVIYDTVNSLLYLAGGRYENLDEGITH